MVLTRNALGGLGVEDEDGTGWFEGAEQPEVSDE